MDVGGMSGTHVRPSSIAERAAIDVKAGGSPRIAVKRPSRGLPSSHSIEKGGSPFRAEQNGDDWRRFPTDGNR